MEYPKLPIEQDRRRVLLPREIEEMKQLRLQKYSSRKIGEMYGVSHTIVLYHTGTDEYREKRNKARYARIKQLEKEDPEYKAQRKEQKKENAKDLLKRCEDKRKWKGKANYKWKKSKRNNDAAFKKKQNEQAKEAYHKKMKDEKYRKKLSEQAKARRYKKKTLTPSQKQ